jgi:exonuclease VII small subunit
MNIAELAPKLAKLTANKIDEYSMKIPEIGMEVLKYEGLCKVSDKLNKSIKVLGEKRIKETDIAVDKLEREILKLECSVNTPEENMRKAKKKEEELEEAEEQLAILENIYKKSNTEINPIPLKLREANNKLSDIMRKRMSVLEKATRYLERAKSNKEWIIKVLTLHKEEIESELKSLMIYKGLDVISLLSTSEKRIVFNQVIKRYDQIKKQHNKLILQVLNKKAEINRIGEYFRTVEKDSDEFQSSVDDMQLGMIALTLNEIEKSKKDIEESKKIHRSQLMNIINTLMSVEANIEQSITQRVEDYKDCKNIPSELENNFKEVMERAMSNLMEVKGYLEKEFKKDGELYSMCEDGKPGKVQLSCGHWMCYKCFFKVRSKEKLIVCDACGGAKQEIGLFFK